MERNSYFSKNFMEKNKDLLDLEYCAYVENLKINIKPRWLSPISVGFLPCGDTITKQKNQKNQGDMYPQKNKKNQKFFEMDLKFF